MDRIFKKSDGIWDVVKLANTEAHMYGPNGELLRTLDDVEDEAVRRASVLSNPAKRAAEVQHQHNEVKESDGNSSSEK